MASQHKIEEAMDICLKEMFNRVGETYPNDELVNEHNWYMLRSWTELEQKAFENWMISYLRKSLRWTKKQSVKEVGFFLLQYGWTTKQQLSIATIKT